MKRFHSAFLLSGLLLGLPGFAQNIPQPAQPTQPAPQPKLKVSEIKNAYNYFLARLLILRQEHQDFKESGFQWNTLYPREPGETKSSYDVATTEAWLAIDNKSCAIVDFPQINDRYYTFQVINGWGETVANINERNNAKKPFGKFAFCTKDSKAQIAKDIQRIDLEGKKFKAFARIELGANPEVAKKLQSEIKLSMQGEPKIAEPVEIPMFDNKNLVGAQGFEKAEEILKSEPDTNPGSEELQQKVRLLSSAIKDKSRRTNIDNVLKSKIIPNFFAEAQKKVISKNGWERLNVVGNYKNDFLARSYANLVDIWANNDKETITYRAVNDSTGKPMMGNNVYAMTFPKGQMPQNFVNNFWSLSVVDAVSQKVIENPAKRYGLGSQNTLVQNKDGSTTVVFASRLPEGFSNENWIPVQEGMGFNLAFRLYGPKNNKYVPPLVGHLMRSMQAEEAKPAE